MIASQVPLLEDQLISTSRKLPNFSSEDLLSLHKKLVETESITGNEKSVGNWLVSYLADKGLTVEKQVLSKEPERFNVFAYPGKHRQTKILVSSHFDTVPPFWPYELRANGTEIWGRGTVDAKACVAAQTIAVLSLLDDLPADTVSLLFVVGEEASGDGMRKFSDEGLKYSAVIFGEPTEGKLASGHKGILGWTIKVKGKASHSGYPELGLNANVLLVEALNEMLWLQDYFPSSEKYGNSTLNIGKITGGVAGNVIPENAEAALTLRIANGSVSAISLMVVNQLAQLKQKATAVGGDVSIEWLSTGYGPVYIDSDIKGFEKIVVNYGTDIPNFVGDHKKYLYGPGSILVAHSDHEHLKVTELEQATKDYQKIILAVLEKE